jgi:hypothetical protein
MLALLMILLTGTSDLVQLVTGSAGSIDVHASWVDNNAGTITPGRTNTAITTAATTTVVGSPAASTQRNLQTLNIRNKHATSSNLVTVQHTDGATAVQLFAYTLLAGEELSFMDGVGFRVIDASGSTKTVAATGRYLGTTVLTTGTTFTTKPQTTTIFIRVQGPGGGGGGVALNAAGLGTCAGGGAAGSYAEKTFTVLGNTAYTYAIGAAGAAGASGGGTGGNAGGASTFAVGGVTVICPSGLGGTFRGTLATAGFALGGASGATATNGDANQGGSSGGHGELVAAGASGCGGAGGDSMFGNGGAERITTGAGVVGVGFGAGGSGALSLTAGAAALGGAGVAGVIVVDEYA